MAYERMDIESIFVGGGPVASLMVLRTSDARAKKPRKLPIQIGGVEAAAIGMAADRKPRRPMTHDLLLSSVEKLGGKLNCVRITGVEGRTFFAQLDLVRVEGEHVFVDARPSDAVALAVGAGVPVYADDSVLEAADFPDFKGVETAEAERELKEFHDFVEDLSPDDFNVEK